MLVSMGGVRSINKAKWCKTNSELFREKYHPWPINSPSKTWIETKLITLPTSNPEKSNRNVGMITLLESKPEKSNQNARMITLLCSNQRRVIKTLE
ncbi:hypothetical protein BKP35_18390 [Anaerobacillus arseniciselenatis]|uniref:Uncharacterized protein n=2 Tax=Anaerobacillus arseniciselenatis TaxID=85682 RepID=A0A1S2L6P5_9BACI|nr:hypothetical protein BKP35_18390 [Anaerobacillus arseniciselenatis]